jgi:hypothetical protein
MPRQRPADADARAIDRPIAEDRRNVGGDSPVLRIEAADKLAGLAIHKHPICTDLQPPDAVEVTGAGGGRPGFKIAMDCFNA